MGEGIRRRVWVWVAVAVVLVAALGFVTYQSYAKPGKNLTLATTTSAQDSGLLDVLIPAFEKASGIKVKIIAVGTGQSIELGRRGDADVVFVHARKLEDQFVADGQGINRRDVMYTDFIIVGPAADPAKIKGMKDPAAAFAQVAAAKANFVSRGDKSGTNVKELDIWALAKVKPAGTWYLNAGAGMDEALRLAAEKGAYTLVDRATYLFTRDKYKLDIMVEGDKFLFNPYGVIDVNPKVHPNVNYRGAEAFARFITGPEGRKIIGDYGRERFGIPLFFPWPQGQ